MKQTTALGKAPSPNSGDSSTKTEGGSVKSHNSVFITMALDMSWRLAIVVLVPIIGGFKLDDVLNSSPALTILGFLIAMGGFALVCWQTLQAANRVPVPKAKEKRS